MTGMRRSYGGNNDKTQTFSDVGQGRCRAWLRLSRLAAHRRAGRVSVMSIIGWIILGLISGFIASKLVNKTGEGVILDIVLGIVGAVVGGYLFSIFGAHGVTGVNLYSLFVAVIGAVVVLVVYHAV